MQEKIVGEIYTDEHELKSHFFYKETSHYFLCYSEWSRTYYKIHKSKVYHNKDELKFIRWARKVHERKMNKRIKYLNSTKMTEFKKRYIETYPEKLI